MENILPLTVGELGGGAPRQWYELHIAHRAADFPGFPVPSLEAFTAQCRGRAANRAWAAWEGERLLGAAAVELFERDGRTWAVPQVDVRAEDRRRGIGTALLRAVLAQVRAEGRAGTLVHEQLRIGGAGDRWARAVGFTEVLRNCWQLLPVAATDPALWRVPMPAGYRLEGWTNAAPVHLVTAFAAARNAIGDAPTGSSSYRPPEWTVERVRRAEAEARAAGDELRQLVAVHEESGEVAALTGLLLRPERLELCWQRDTAVARAHRGLGLGRAVKAAMMRRLLAERPGLGRVITSTAADNAAMIRVNERLGYLRYAEIGVFEADPARLGAALGSRSIPGPRLAAAAHDCAVSGP